MCSNARDPRKSLPGLSNVGEVVLHVALLIAKPRRHCQKGTHPCMYPACNKVFNRPADLERHYKNVHASDDAKEKHHCDYTKCERSFGAKPFGRKDHFRDHLRDYHKEDIGAAKGQKIGKGSKHNKKWKEDQRAWLAERVINFNWWRCARCLRRVDTAIDGYQCGSCKLDCESERVRHRTKLYEHENYQSFPSGRSTGDTPRYSEPATAYNESCSHCGGSAWIENLEGGYTACPNCQPSIESSSYTSYTNGSQYATEGCGSSAY